MVPGRTSPDTPKAANQEGDAAFSFPVTPVSEPPAAAEPGAVFKTWPSFRKDKKGARRPDSRVGNSPHLEASASSVVGAPPTLLPSFGAGQEGRPQT